MNNADTANNANTANQAQSADMAHMADIPNVELIQHAIALTDMGPRGGWRAYGGHFGRGGGGGGNTDTIDVNVDVSGTIDTTVTPHCEDGLTQCKGYCADISFDFDNCGQCGKQCPEGGSCDEPGVCECPTDFKCQYKGKCVKDTHDYACGEYCDTCPDAKCPRNTDCEFGDINTYPDNYPHWQGSPCVCDNWPLYQMLALGPMVGLNAMTRATGVTQDVPDGLLRKAQRFRAARARVLYLPWLAVNALQVGKVVPLFRFRHVVRCECQSSVGHSLR
ncbi:hypothetical protein V8F06_007661 [Rhypophila decipiens]